MMRRNLKCQGYLGEERFSGYLAAGELYFLVCSEARPEEETFSNVLSS